MKDIIFFVPHILVCLSAFFMLILSCTTIKNIRWYAFFVSFILLACSIFYILNLSREISFIPLPNVFKGAVVIDSFSLFFDAILLLGASLNIFALSSYYKKFAKRESYCLILFALFGMMVFVHSNELILTFLSLEIASVCIYFLICYNNEQAPDSLEAGYKYLLLSSIFAVLFIFGAALIFAQANTTNLSGIALYILNGTNTNLLNIGVAMIFIVFLFKLAIFPFSFWALDVYDSASLPVANFMISVFKISLFAFFLRFLFINLNGDIQIWADIFSVLAVATVIYGTLLAVTQNSIKRMLISSSIANSGLILMLFAAIASGNIQAGVAVLFYLISYFFASFGAFTFLYYANHNNQQLSTYKDFRGFYKKNPHLGLAMVIFLLSYAGIPITLGFIAKFFLFLEVIKSGLFVLFIVGILASIVSLYYYFRAIASLCFYHPKQMPSGYFTHIKKYKTFITYLIAFIVLLGGISYTINGISFEHIFNIGQNAISSIMAS